MTDTPDGRPDGRNDGSIIGLFSDAMAAMTRLVRGEIALARSEAEQALERSARAALQIGIAAILALVGLNVLAGASVAGLVALGLAPGWAGLIVGAVLLLLGLGYLQFGLGLLRKARRAPGQTIQGLRKDIEALKTGMAGDER